MGTEPTNPAMQIGREYVESETLPATGAHAAARKVARINAHLYEQIPVPVVWTENDPYDSYADMRESVRRDDEFRVFSGGTHPPHFTREENVKGRAVHDWFGHLAADVPFDLEGEYGKWRHMCVRERMYPRDTWAFLFAEVVGQLCAAIYLPDGFDSDRFEQRTCVAPDRWIDAVANYVADPLR